MRTNIKGVRYLLWFVYALLTAVATTLLLREAAGGTAAGLLGTAAVLCAAGVLVSVLHRLSGRIQYAGNKQQPIQSVAEAALVVVLLALGLVLRVRQMDEMGQLKAYFEMAEVVPGKTIPQLVHGAVYFYIRLLHGVFYFLGNKFAAGIWLQIVLQLMGALVLYVATKRLSGHLAALTVLAFLTCSPYMIQKAMLLSPEPFFLLLCALVLSVMTAARGGVLFPAGFFAFGLLIGAVSFLDIGGVLLLLPMLALAMEEREPKEKGKRKMTAVLLGMAGAVLGLGGCMAGDAWLSGKKMAGVAGAWLKLYRAGHFAIPARAEEVSLLWDWFVLCGLLALGIFSFWCDKKRDDAGVYTAGLCLVLAGCLFGVFTEEMPGEIFVYLLLVLLAGVAVEGCMGAQHCRGAQRGVEASDAEKHAERQPGGESEHPERQSERQHEPVQGNYIENPLPLPKKHVKRVLDYDIEISDDDDFDI